MIRLDIGDLVNSITGDGPIVTASEVRSVTRLSRAGEWSASVPATDPKLANVGIKYYIDAWDGQDWIAGGTIEEISLRKRGAAGSLDMSGGDPLNMLARVRVRKVEIDGSAAPGAALLALLALLPSNWSYQIDGTLIATSVRFIDDNLLGALIALGERTGQMFRMERNGGSWLLRWFDSPADSGLLATDNVDGFALERNANACKIDNIERASSGWQISNRLVCYGSGNSDARLTLAAATQWPDGSSISSDYFETTISGVPMWFRLDRADNTISEIHSQVKFGQYSSVVEFSDIGPISNNSADVIAAANALVAAAVGSLREVARETETYHVQLVAGQNTHSLTVGSSIAVQCRWSRDGKMPININKRLIILEISRTWQKGIEVGVDIVVSDATQFPRSDNEILIREIRNSQVMRAYPQLNANSYVLPFSKSIDYSLAAAFRFRLGAEVTQLQQVLFEFQILPLESTVRSVVAASTTSSAGGDSTQTSTYSAPNTYHAHNIPIPSIGGGPYGTLVYVDSTFGLNTATASKNGGADPTSVDITHAHNVSIPAHTHDVTPDIQTDYGIFRESGSNTLGLVEIEYQVNGGGWGYAATAVAVGSGWYRLDITALLQDATTLRPLQESNLVEMRGTVDKTCAIDAQLSVRNVIQAIAYR